MAKLELMRSIVGGQAASEITVSCVTSVMKGCVTVRLWLLLCVRVRVTNAIALH